MRFLEADINDGNIELSNDMIFLDLIEILRNKQATLDLAEREAPFAEQCETVSVYLKDDLALTSEVKFVDAEAELASNFAERDSGPYSYCDFATLSYLQEVVEEYVATYPDWDNARIGQRMIEYRIN